MLHLEDALQALRWVHAQVASLVVVNVQTSVSWAVGFAGTRTLCTELAVCRPVPQLGLHTIANFI